MESIKKAVHGNDIVNVLKIKPFLFMMLSEFFSQIAFNMQHFVLIFIIYGFTRSNTAVSGLILSFMIPAVLFSVASGVYVDRWNKKKVLLTTHLLRAGLLFPFLIPHLHLVWIYALTFLIAVVTQFFNPAESSIIPQLVPKNLIVSANAVFSFAIFGIILIGYILSGPILLLLGRTCTILLLISLFLISSIFVLNIKLTPKKKELSIKKEELPFSFASEAVEIFSFIKKTKRIIHALSLITIAQTVIFMFAVLAPGYVTTVLEAPLESLSLVLVAPASLGLAIGAFVLGSKSSKFNHERMSAIGFLIVGIVFILLPFASRVDSSRFIQTLNTFLPKIFDITILHIIILLAFITGIGISLVFIPSNSTIQIETGEDMRGRMYGLLNSLIGAISFLPVILAGGLADLFGVSVIFRGVGILMLFIGFFYLFIFKFKKL